MGDHALARRSGRIPIIASETTKHTAPSAVHGVGSRASSAAHTMAPSTPM